MGEISPTVQEKVPSSGITSGGVIPVHKDRKGCTYTLEEDVQLQGKGLHTGEEITLTLRGAQPGTGIAFRRLDLPGQPVIKAGPKRVVDTQRATTLGCEGHEVIMVEHLMAAAFLAGLDDLMVEISGPELPILDGSCAPYLQALLQGKKKPQQGERRTVYSLQSPCYWEEGGARGLVLPHPHLRISYVLYGRDSLEDQFLDREGSFQDLAPARTFGWMQDVHALLAQGLIKGGSSDCALLYDVYGPRSSLRLPYEPVAHKIIDFLGDLFLLGYVQGHFVVMGGGHTLHNKMARDLEHMVGEDG